MYLLPTCLEGQGLVLSCLQTATSPLDGTKSHTLDLYCRCRSSCVVVVTDSSDDSKTKDILQFITFQKIPKTSLAIVLKMIGDNYDSEQKTMKGNFDKQKHQHSIWR